MNKRTYSVLVGNVGVVHSGHNLKAANKIYLEYKRMSKQGYGRMGFEDVRLLWGDTTGNGGEIRWFDGELARRAHTAKPADYAKVRAHANRPEVRAMKEASAHKARKIAIAAGKDVDIGLCASDEVNENKGWAGQHVVPAETVQQIVDMIACATSVKVVWTDADGHNTFECNPNEKIGALVHDPRTGVIKSAGQPVAPNNCPEADCLDVDDTGEESLAIITHSYRELVLMATEGLMPINARFIMLEQSGSLEAGE